MLLAISPYSIHLSVYVSLCLFLFPCTSSHEEKPKLTPARRLLLLLSIDGDLSS